MTNKYDIHEIIHRMRGLAHVGNDSQLAAFIGVKPSAISQIRRRGKWSKKSLKSICIDHDWDYDFVEKGKTPENPSDMQKDVMNSGSYETIDVMNSQIKEVRMELFKELMKEIGKLEQRIEQLERGQKLREMPKTEGR